MPTTSTLPRTAARWAGLGYLAIFVFAVFANFLALGAVLDPSDAGATARALTEHESTFRLGTIAFLAIFLVDIVVSWALYVLFRDVHGDLAVLAAWFRLSYTVMLGVALVFLSIALQLNGTRAGAPRGQDGLVLLALQAFDFTWVAGLAAFGLHLVLVGRLLLLTGGRALRLLGTVLAVAGGAYVLDTVAHVAMADYESHASVFLAIVAVPSVLGELALTGWLLLVATGRAPVPTRPSNETGAAGRGERLVAAR